MRIKINHVSKIEGQAGFVADILDGDVRKAKIEIHSAARLIEGLLIGRHYSEAPIITSRICGICPVVHNLASVKAIESAFGIKPSAETINLRKLMHLGQIIHSHGLHVFFLSLADFFDLENDLNLAKKYPKEAEWALKIREFGIELDKVIGGRTVHPIRSEVGGFKKFPSRAELKKLLIKAKETLPSAISLGHFFAKLKYPKFERQTKHVCLKNKKEYALYDGKVNAKKIIEIETMGETVKQTRWQNNVFMVGALSRLNNNYAQLHKESKKLWPEKLPCYNSFYNILAQSVEIVHCLEESINLLERLVNSKLENKKAKFRVRAGQGSSSIEAPRGTLYHYYELDKDGFIKNCNIITPTAQFLGNLEEDIKAFLPNLKKLKSNVRRKKIRMLIRAYDPCITCATH